MLSFIAIELRGPHHQPHRTGWTEVRARRAGRAGLHDADEGFARFPDVTAAVTRNCRPNASAAEVRPGADRALADASGTTIAASGLMTAVQPKEGTSAPRTVLDAGLTTDEARNRLATVGPNELKRGETTSPWRLLAGQFGSPLIWLLLAASVISALLGEVADAIAIGAILIINALVGFFQEYRAEKAMLALRSMTAPRARVRRDGHAVTISAAEVVPGDLILL